MFRSIESGSVKGADNVIPMELALKIAKTIRENERFSVYIVMWPEGVPSISNVQEILFWQEYLNFYCPGKREASSLESSPETNTENRSLLYLILL
ncbi:hypothetical protein FNV43_RR05385 [Rhamnella rubrinervis]|uniref:Uncharacterized protein n=1 Tax=Rhamnella rubrinervis TaxID=2594499 RepID=A0A8K0HLA1_9ROSA|nr:hypothetical protein FNV43_RR05385 [Rhamnella rubrinervis]